MGDVLRSYVRRFAKLRRGTTKYGPAPHKPILLLAVIQGYDEGWISGNRIELTPELVAAFKTLWHGLVSSNHSPLIAQPFFYMRGDGFWSHVSNPGYEGWVAVTRNCNSLGALHKAVAYARIDEALYALMCSPQHRTILQEALLDTYFPGRPGPREFHRGYWETIERQILKENPARYQAEISRLEQNLDAETFEEELFVRSGVFKRQVPQIYNNTCCISGLRIETTLNASLIDACHIVPFSESRDDTISNGIALCPTLHRAFDRGVLAIDPETYQVRVSPRIVEPLPSAYSIRQFDGQRIHLPANPLHYPGRTNLRLHMERFGGCFG